MREMPPEIELCVNEKLSNERDKSDKLYPSMTRFTPVEKIVYTSISIALVAMATKLVSMALNK